MFPVSLLYFHLPFGSTIYFHDLSWWMFWHARSEYSGKGLANGNHIVRLWLLSAAASTSETTMKCWHLTLWIGGFGNFRRAIRNDLQHPLGYKLVRQFVRYVCLPVVPRKAVAEVSKIGNYRRGELLWCMDGRANPLMDRKVVEALNLSLSPPLPLSLTLSVTFSLHLSISPAVFSAV